jgi:neutral ceramidase
VLHLRAGTASIAIVQCDLLGGSSVLQRLVAKRIEEVTDIPLAGVMIGATHTHAGPGQFLGTDFYNRFASNRRGFDPTWTTWLVDRISGAVIDAYASRQPAAMAVGSTPVWGLTRNRSHDPYLRNESVEDKRTDAQRKYAAINPLLHMVRVDTVGEDPKPLGGLVVFSVHGTGVSQKSREYNADLWAYLVGELTNRVATMHGTRPVIGAIEGTHADVAPALRPTRAGHLEAKRVGRAIGAEAAELYEALEKDLRTDVELGAGLREVSLAGGASIDGVSLPDRPAVGAALVAGAHENTTPVVHALPPFRAGHPNRWARPGNPQGVKWVLGSRVLQPLVLPPKSFPRVVPVQLLRLGNTALVGLPFEITVESGRRIAAAASEGLGGAEVVVSSVANEYFGYIATAEEYERQFYEGGHTLYGPNTQRFIAAHAGKLASDLSRSASTTLLDVEPTRTWDLGVGKYWPEPTGAKVRRLAIGRPRFVDPTPNDDGYWEFTWRDNAPGDLHWNQPLVIVEAQGADGTWELANRHGREINDQGWDLDIERIGSDEVGTLYRARWHDPEVGVPYHHRFVILPNGEQPRMESDPFD